MITKWHFLDPRITTEHLGLLSTMLWDTDPRPAAEQFNERYAHGGGWNPMDKFKFDPETITLSYPGDPPYKGWAQTQLRDERIILFDYAFVAIIQPDGSYEVARMD